jgi:hypothetical protein
MSVRARYDGPSGTGVDVTVELDTGEFRTTHVKQGGLLPEDINGVAITPAFRNSLLDQDDWTKYQQQSTSSAKSDDKKEG